MPKQRKSCTSIRCSPRCNNLWSGIRAGVAGAFIDRMVETKGLDALDRHKAKKHGELPVYVRKFQRLTIARS